MEQIVVDIDLKHEYLVSSLEPASIYHYCKGFPFNFGTKYFLDHNLRIIKI